MSQEQNITTVKEIYDAVGRGDVDAILDRVTDNVDWAAEATGNAAPWYGRRTGKDGAASFFGDLAQSIEITEFSRTASPPGTMSSTYSSTGRSDRSRPAGRPR